MRSKKGITPTKVIVGLILLIFSAFIIIAVYSAVVAPAPSGVGSTYCSFASYMRSNSLRLFPETCMTQTVHIDPTNTVLCPNAVSIAGGTLPGYGCSNTAYTTEEDCEAANGIWGLQDIEIQPSPHWCASEQLAQLATRCWAMRGAGAWDPGDFTCFYACLQTAVDEGGTTTYFAKLGDVATMIANGNFVSPQGDEIAYKDILPLSRYFHQTGSEALLSGQYVRIDFDEGTDVGGGGLVPIAGELTTQIIGGPKDKILIKKTGAQC